MLGAPAKLINKYNNMVLLKCWNKMGLKFETTKFQHGCLPFNH
jgi:hypothetical protein